MAVVPPEIVDQIISNLQPSPPGFLQTKATEEHTESINAIGRCASVCGAWLILSRRYHFKHWIITLRDPNYSPSAKTLEDLIQFVSHPLFPHRDVQSLVVRNDPNQVMLAFQAGGMVEAKRVDFTASFEDIVRLVRALPGLTIFKLAYFNVLKLADTFGRPVPYVQLAFDGITHFTFAGRADVSSGTSMPYAELCTLLSSFRTLEELVLDDIDIDNTRASGAISLPSFRSLRKLVIHRCDDIARLVENLTTQVGNSQLPLLRYLEVGNITPRSQDAAHRLIEALAPQLTSLTLGYDYIVDLQDYLHDTSFPLSFDSATSIIELRVVLDVSDPRMVQSSAFEHLTWILANIRKPASNIQTLVIEYGEIDAVVAVDNEPNFTVLADMALHASIDLVLTRNFRALRAVRFVPLREYNSDSFSGDDQGDIRQNFRGLDLRGLLTF